MLLVVVPIGAMLATAAWAKRGLSASRRGSSTSVEDMSVPFLLLPSELVVDVLGRLEARDLCAVAGSCKELRGLASSDEIWHPLFKSCFEPLPTAVTQAPWWEVGIGREHRWKTRFQRLASGSKFCAQVFNREIDNPNEDFTHSCYDATVTFQGFDASSRKALYTAKYLPQGKERVLEHDITADRLRPAPPGTRSHKVHPWKLQDFMEGQGVEVQWRGAKSHPFGWWLGTVQQVLEEAVVVSFAQYPLHSPWRRVVVPRKVSPDEGAVNYEPCYGYLGGVRAITPQELELWIKHRVVNTASSRE